MLALQLPIDMLFQITLSGVKFSFNSPLTEDFEIEACFIEIGLGLEINYIIEQLIVKTDFVVASSQLVKPYFESTDEKVIVG